MAVTYVGNKIIGNTTDITPATFSDDFTGSDGWAEVGTPDTYVDTSADELVVKMDRNGTNNKCVYDLGTGNVSDSKWVLRYNQVNFSNTGSTNALGYSGISSVSQSSGQTTAPQDFIGMIWNDNGEVDYYGTVYNNDSGNGLTTGQNSAWNGSYAAQQNFDFQTSTDYWIEISRINTSEMRIRCFSDSFHHMIFEMKQAIPTGVTGLRYITFFNRMDTTGDVPIAFKVQKVEFWNNVSSVNKPLNASIGTIFIEVDTGKQYIFDGTDWDLLP